jgi:hypothetical protein
VFGDGLRRPLDRERRARVLYLLRAHRGSGGLTACHWDVGEALVRHLSADGRCDPSQATLAAETGCSERTVRRATARLRQLGLLRWQARLVRAGWRAEQTSNAYELVPTADPPPPGNRRRACGGQTGREILKVDISCLSGGPEHPALALRRAAIEARLLARRSGGQVPAI